MSLAAAEVARNVSQALDILRRPGNEFALDFLLATGEDAAGDMVMLSNPIALSHASTASVKGVRSREGASTREDDAAAAAAAAAAGDVPLEVVYTMIPAMCVGKVMAGIAVHRVGCPLANPGTVTYCMGRFVRDEETAETLIVNTPISPGGGDGGEEPGSIVYLRHDTPKQRFHLYLLLAPCVPFRAIYRDFMACNNPALVSHVLFAESVQQTRLNGCPECGRPGLDDCSCQLSLVVPKSVVDFSSFRANHDTHLGLFACETVVSQREPAPGADPGADPHAQPCDTPRRPRTAFKRFTVPSQDHLINHADQSISDLLQRLAVQDRILRASPTRTVVPAGSAPRRPAVCAPGRRAAHHPHTHSHAHPHPHPHPDTHTDSHPHIHPHTHRHTNPHTHPRGNIAFADIASSVLGSGMGVTLPAQPAFNAAYFSRPVHASSGPMHSSSGPIPSSSRLMHSSVPHTQVSRALGLDQDQVPATARVEPSVLRPESYLHSHGAEHAFGNHRSSATGVGANGAVGTGVGVDPGVDPGFGLGLRTYDSGNPEVVQTPTASPMGSGSETRTPSACGSGSGSGSGSLRGNGDGNRNNDSNGRQENVQRLDPVPEQGSLVEGLLRNVNGVLLDQASRRAGEMPVDVPPAGNGEPLDFEALGLDFVGFLDSNAPDEFLDSQACSSPQESHVFLEQNDSPEQMSMDTAVPVANGRDHRTLNGTPGTEQRHDLALTRKEKNRLAAARSNAKRKKQMDDLKSNLASAKEQMRALSEQEAILKKHNLELKDSAARLWLQANTVRER